MGAVDLDKVKPGLITPPGRIAEGGNRLLDIRDRQFPGNSLDHRWGRDRGGGHLLIMIGLPTAVHQLYPEAGIIRFDRGHHFFQGRDTVIAPQGR